MKTSVLIIAHNEEKYIGKCIESVLHQTQKADEIILVAHNCTDQTELLAKKYPINVISFAGPIGITYARIEGLKRVTGDIILCIDGDSYAAPNWISEMTKALSRNRNTLVGSWIKTKGTFFSVVTSLFNKYFCVSKNKTAAYWIWGPSMAFWGRDKERIKTTFEESFTLSEKLGLSRNPDDFWLALFMSNYGNMEVINTTSVTAHVKEKTSQESWKRNIENNKNARRMKIYMKSV